MTAQNLADFHLNEQKEELLIEECEKIVKAFEPEPNSTTMTMDGKEFFGACAVSINCYTYLALSSLGFTHFMMFSDLQAITEAKHTSLVYQDMTRPLAHYWIASSHNT